MSFHEVRFPDDIAYGATGGPEFATSIVATASSYEQLNINWSSARGGLDVASGLKKQTQLDTLIAFFRARKGRAHGFRFTKTGRITRQRVRPSARATVRIKSSS